MVRVNAGCKGCIKPPSSLEEEEKKIFKMSQRQKPLETVGRSSKALPRAQYVSKSFFSTGFTVRVPIAENSCNSIPCGSDIKVSQEEKKHDFRLHAAHFHVPSNV